MEQLPPLITDLGLVLAVAAVTTLIFKKIHQPVVLGYVIAGVLVGPHVSLMPTVVDAEGIHIWSEIGVIFLLFSLGLEFSFKKLLKVGGVASVTALSGIVLMNGLGFLVGHLLEWAFMDCLFLGAIVSISSTTIIMRAFDELGIRTKKFASLVFGILIIQDLVAILLLVMLSTFAVSRNFEGQELLTQILKLTFFLILWFLGGIFFIPTFFKRARGLLNDETMLIISVALCLMMVMLAVRVGFSAALGAFIMGSILAETTQAERIESLVMSVRNLFASIFFISVGMMIDPSILVDYALPILLITAIIIVGMTVTIALAALLAGQSLKQAIQAGMSLAQIGEFSFIIASLGASLKVTSAFIYPIAIAASAITTFTTPFLIQRSNNVYLFLETHLPKKWIAGLNRYSTSSQQLAAYSEWKELLRSYGLNSIVHSVLIVGLIFISERFIHPSVSSLFKDGLVGTIISISITLILMIPFIWALAIRRINKESYANLWLNRKINRGPLIAIEIARIVIAVVLVGILINIYFPLAVAFVIAILSMSIATILFNQKLQMFYERLESRFLSNLNERETRKVVRNEITPWDAHLATFDVHPDFKHVGKQLKELQLREKYGVNIALIERGKLSIFTPDRFERLYPGDKLSIIGTDDQLSAMTGIFDRDPNDNGQTKEQNVEISLQNFTITNDSRLLGKTIRKSRIRQDAQALVVGFERNGQRFLNPESSVDLQDGDIVWIVGVKEKIEDFLAQK